ncbi:MAG: hypothetical protein LBK02_03180 [Treponema sp.]|jgi:hypothetical protein|nr:hypothetical protein [Treponema sp.]
MDYRKKSIADLENSKQTALGSLNLIMEDLGARLLKRAGEAGFSSEAVPVYKRLQQEAADSAGLIEGIEEDSLRLQALDEDIEQKKQEQAARLENLSGLYRSLGEQGLEEPQYGDMAVFYRQRADILIPRTEALAARLVKLEAREGANVFTWFGKSVQAMAVRSLLAKSQKDLDRLHEEAGEQFSRSGEQALPPPAGKTGLLEDIENLKGLSRDSAEELAALREERRKTGLFFNAKGGPVVRIQGLEKQIARIKQELKNLYLQFGEEAAKAGNKKRFAPLLNEDDKQTLEKIALLRKTLKEYDREIEKNEASLAMDEEKKKIEKLEQAIREQRDRIAAAEKIIAKYTQKHEASRTRIEELSGILAGAGK